MFGARVRVRVLLFFYFVLTLFLRYALCWCCCFGFIFFLQIVRQVDRKSKTNIVSKWLERQSKPLGEWGNGTFIYYTSTTPRRNARVQLVSIKKKPCYSFGYGGATVCDSLCSFPTFVVFLLLKTKYIYFILFFKVIADGLALGWCCCFKPILTMRAIKTTTTTTKQNKWLTNDLNDFVRQSVLHSI